MHQEMARLDDDSNGDDPDDAADDNDTDGHDENDHGAFN